MRPKGGGPGFGVTWVFAKHKAGSFPYYFEDFERFGPLFESSGALPDDMLNVLLGAVGKAFGVALADASEGLPFGVEEASGG